MESEGRSKGRNDKENGLTGVSRMAFSCGLTIAPPLAMEYAVLPLGVEIISPSPFNCVKGGPPVSWSSLYLQLILIVHKVYLNLATEISLRII